MRRCSPPPFLLPLLLLTWAVAAVAAAEDLDGAIARLSHDDVRERVAAANTLGRCGPRPECARAVRALERSVFDAQPAVRRASLAALTALDARGAAGAVVRLLQVERDVTVLPGALIALGRLRAAGSEALLVRHAAHPLPRVRAAAVTAAGDLGGLRMRRLVLNSLQIAGPEDGEWLVRSSAILALARIGRREDLAIVQRAFQQGGGTTSWLARSAVAKAIAALHPTPRAALERLMLDPDPRVAVTAAAGLAEAGFPSVLLDQLRHRTASARAAAVGGVRKAQLRKAAARLRRMARMDRSRTVRWAAAVTLFAWGDPAGDELMLDAVRAKDPAIWGEAVARLGRRTGASHGRDVAGWSKALRAARSR